jgi:exosortase A
VIWLTVAILGLLALHATTVRSMMKIWTDNDSFAHCWFVAPLSLYMVWRNRTRLATVTPRPSALGLTIVVGFGAAWFLGRIGAIQVVQQMSLVGMLLGAVWAVVGWPAFRIVAYPLAFLFMAVPFGEGLFPVLISIAGRLAVAVLRITGTPVGFDGFYLRVPNGEWQITEACSGLRFLLSVLTVGAVFAYTNYRHWWKRVAFLTFCVVAAILTNGFRVWILVIVGIFTYMKSPLVHKHASLGWVLFAIMILVLFAVGRRWADPETVEERPVPPSRPPRPGPARARSGMAFATASVLALAIGAAWPFVAHALDREQPGAPSVSLEAPADQDGWTSLPFAPMDWTPHYVGARATVQQAYEKSLQTVGLYVAYYRNQHQGAELNRVENGLQTPGDKSWRYFGETRRTVPEVGLRVGEVDARSWRGSLLVWRWYWTGSRFTEDPRAVKLDGVRSKLLGRGDDAAVLMLYAPYEKNGQEASAAMVAFLKDMKPRIDQMVMGAAGGH